MTRNLIAATAAVTALASLSPLRAQQEPVCKDQTGIDWVLPFEAAVEHAEATNRILMVKPIAFGTTRDGGW